MNIVKKISFAALLGLVSSMAVFCSSGSKENDEGKPVIEISVSEVGVNSAVIAVKSLNTSYVSVAVSKAPALPSAEQIIEQGAKVSGNSYVVDNLEEATTYYVFAVGVSPSGKQKSMVQTTGFTTNLPPVVDPFEGIRDGVCRVVLESEDLYVSTYMDENHDAIYQFRKCMFNELFTFYRVGSVTNTTNTLVHPKTSPEVQINATSSDNIGPIGIGSSGWVGGNHKYREGTVAGFENQHSAVNVSWKVYVDGVEIKSGTECKGQEVKVVVNNRLYDSTVDGDKLTSTTFSNEYVEYFIENGSIRVNLTHNFEPTDSRTISRYYGMQSMFVGETEFLTPASVYSTWKGNLSTLNTVQISRGSDPDFRMFIERRNSEAFQTTYLINKDLGEHAWISESSPIFIGNSYGKFYHVQIENHSVKKGDKATWHGIYTWYVKPLVDNQEMFCHLGKVEGKHAVYVNCLKAAEGTVTVPGGCKSVTVYDSRGDIKIEKTAEGAVSVNSSGAAYAIVQYEL